LTGVGEVRFYRLGGRLNRARRVRTLTTAVRVGQGTGNGDSRRFPRRIGKHVLHIVGLPKIKYAYDNNHEERHGESELDKLRAASS
jgi:hypothetical protein